LTTHRFKFADVEQAFALMVSKKDNILKPLIQFT
jgi:threonine dehydrogenase-like Zn-dependent dehydrogenase